MEGLALVGHLTCESAWMPRDPITLKEIVVPASLPTDPNQAVTQFHGAPAHLAKDIREQGLRPGPRRDAVFVTRDRETALRYAEGRAGEATVPRQAPQPGLLVTAEIQAGRLQEEQGRLARPRRRVRRIASPAGPAE